ncbi:MAG: UDP-N-acetylmuramoyl-L-alanyl-D-glutamate--2,6-diaminopimelate ligase [Roseburia sp.]|nr:UDP-N-acetylmuramoyl-L-alanyl-D-glutamate--2,6-diaminopimelate ligase [Roseburia sp.]
MQLDRLVSQLTYERVQGSQNREITDICYHSGKVKEGSLFVCLKGLHADGHDYLMDALNGGAAAVVIAAENTVRVEGDILLYTEKFGARISELQRDWGVAVILVEDTREALAELSAAFFGHPAEKLCMIGITGTKGKTTTAYLTAAILREAGYKTGMIGTICIDDGERTLPATHTTPEAYEIQKYLAGMVENGCAVCVMEVSSQGLKMQRVRGIRYKIGMFLNIEPDHIGPGEHASFAEYLFCKSRLLRQCELGIVNRDDPHTERILQGHTCEVETFSVRHPAAVTADNIRFFMEEGRLFGSFRMCAGDGQLPVRMQLPGVFNVYNALAAALAARHLGVTGEQIQRALCAAQVPGRCENISPSRRYVLLLDYAHNEMSLKNLLETLRQFAPRRLVVIFGCGGNRSVLRRSRMGETAGHLADLSIITSDNPRWEEPEAILDDVEVGIRATGGAYVRIADRREAVSYAVAQAQEGDILVLAGKGHEGYQEIRGVRYPMSEYKLVEDAYQKACSAEEKRRADEPQEGHG